MNMKKLNFMSLTVILCITVASCGCSTKKMRKIQFNVKNRFQEYKKDGNILQDTSLTKSKGYIIYKTNNNSESGFNMNFGPKDINFDLHVR